MVTLIMIANPTIKQNAGDICNSLSCVTIISQFNWHHLPHNQMRMTVQQWNCVQMGNLALKIKNKIIYNKLQRIIICILQQASKDIYTTGMEE